MAKRLIIGGSTSVLPLAQKLATAYHKAYPKIPTPKVGGGQSDVGISGAANGRFDIGDSSRDPIRGVDPNGLVFTKIARDGVCVITNPANPISNISQQETVEGIFTGRDPRLERGRRARSVSGPIDLFDRDGASGTQDAFQHIFLGETLKISPSATAETSNGLEQNAVAQRQAGDRLRVVRLHRRSERGRLPGHPVHARATPSPGSTAACVTSGWSPRACPRARPRSSSSGSPSRQQDGPRSIVSSSWIAIH